MAFSIKDKSTDAAVRKLAKLKNKSLTETICEAVEYEYLRMRGEISLIDRLEDLSNAIARFPRLIVKQIKTFSTLFQAAFDVR